LDVKGRLVECAVFVVGAFYSQKKKSTESWRLRPCLSAQDAPPEEPMRILLKNFLERKE